MRGSQSNFPASSCTCIYLLPWLIRIIFSMAQPFQRITSKTDSLQRSTWDCSASWSTPVWGRVPQCFLYINSMHKLFTYWSTFSQPRTLIILGLQTVLSHFSFTSSLLLCYLASTSGSNVLTCQVWPGFVIDLLAARIPQVWVNSSLDISLQNRLDLFLSKTVPLVFSGTMMCHSVLHHRKTGLHSSML